MQQPDLQRVIDAAELLCLMSPVSDVLEPFDVTSEQLAAALHTHVDKNTVEILRRIEQMDPCEWHSYLRAHLTGQVIRGMVIGRVFGRREAPCASRE